MTRNDFKRTYNAIQPSESFCSRMEARFAELFDENPVLPDDREKGVEYSPQQAAGKPFKAVISACCAAAAVVICAVGAVWFTNNRPNPAPPVTSDESTPSAPDTAEPIETADTEEAPEFVRGFYDSIFEEAGFNPESGPTPTYDEAIEMVETTGVDSYYLFETIKALTYDECEQLGFLDELGGSSYGSWETVEAGTDLAAYRGDFTIYKVRVLSDLISGEKPDSIMYLYMNSGNPIYQETENPPYSPGERFAAAVYKKSSESTLYRSTCAFMLRFDVYEENGEDYGYLRSDHTRCTPLPAQGAEAVNKTEITSTTQNPVVYAQRIKLDSIAEFIRSDWSVRGLSRHYEAAAEPETEEGTLETADLEKLPPISEPLPSFVSSYFTIHSIAAGEQAEPRSGNEVYFDDDTALIKNMIESTGLVGIRFLQPSDGDVITLSDGTRLYSYDNYLSNRINWHYTEPKAVLYNNSEITYIIPLKSSESGGEMQISVTNGSQNAQIVLPDGRSAEFPDGGMNLINTQRGRMTCTDDRQFVSLNGGILSDGRSFICSSWSDPESGASVQLTGTGCSVEDFMHVFSALWCNSYVLTPVNGISYHVRNGFSNTYDSDYGSVTFNDIELGLSLHGDYAVDFSEATLAETEDIVDFVDSNPVFCSADHNYVYYVYDEYCAGLEHARFIIAGGSVPGDFEPASTSVQKVENRYDGGISDYRVSELKNNPIELLMGDDAERSDSFLSGIADHVYLFENTKSMKTPSYYGIFRKNGKWYSLWVGNMSRDDFLKRLYSLAASQPLPSDYFAQCSEILKSRFGSKGMLSHNILDIDNDGEYEVLALAANNYGNSTIKEMCVFEQTGGRMELASTFGQGCLRGVTLCYVKYKQDDGTPYYVGQFGNDPEYSFIAEIRIENGKYKAVPTIMWGGGKYYRIDGFTAEKTIEECSTEISENEIEMLGSGYHHEYVDINSDDTEEPNCQNPDI